MATGAILFAFLAGVVSALDAGAAWPEPLSSGLAAAAANAEVPGAGGRYHSPGAAAASQAGGRWGTVEQLDGPSFCWLCRNRPEGAVRRRSVAWCRLEPLCRSDARCRLGACGAEPGSLASGKRDGRLWCRRGFAAAGSRSCFQRNHVALETAPSASGPKRPADAGRPARHNRPRYSDRIRQKPRSLPGGRLSTLAHASHDPVLID